MNTNKSKYEKEFFSNIIKNSKNLSDSAKNLGLKPSCGNRKTIKKYISKYNINTSHFFVDYSIRKIRKNNIKLILVENSTYIWTTDLKTRLYKEGLKKPICELCGQDENWQGKKMSLILDHINGINNDNRIKNLRIVCPNCNATLPTHGGKNIGKYGFVNHSEKKHYYCKCGKEMDKKAKQCINCYTIIQRKTIRPPYDQLKNEIKELGYSATGRKYGVSDNAIRKWIRFYEKHAPIV